jgi:hypothetical protein
LLSHESLEFRDKQFAINQSLIYPFAVVDIVENVHDECYFLGEIVESSIVAEVGRQCLGCSIWIKGAQKVLVIEPKRLVVWVEEGFVDKGKLCSNQPLGGLITLIYLTFI